MITESAGDGRTAGSPGGNGEAENGLATLAGSLRRSMRACQSDVSIRLLALLSEGPQDVSTLSARSRTGMTAVSRALSWLRREGILRCEEARSRHIYSLSKQVRVVNRGGLRQIRVSAPAGAEFGIGFPAAVLGSIAWPRAGPKRARKTASTRLASPAGSDRRV